MTTFAATTLWVLAGAAIAAGLSWAFLNTPESTVWTLALSGLFVLALLAAAALTLNAALLSWERGWSWAVVRRAAAGVVPFVLCLLLVLASWWLFGRARDWLGARSGEIGAWFIARVDWSDVRPLTGAAQAVCDWMRMVVVPMAALAWLAAALRDGWPAFVSPVAARRSLAPHRLLAATAVSGACLWAPWTYLTLWVPRGLPPTWVEPAVAVLKFGAMAALGAVGVSLLTRLAASAATRHT
jgi:hypothetical protein